MTTTNSKTTLHCDHCNMTLKNERCYASHVRSNRHIQRIVHGSTSDSSFNCTCGKSYTHRQSLHVHRRTCEQAMKIKLHPLNVKTSATDRANNEESLFCIEYQKELDKVNIKHEIYKTEQDEIRINFEKEILNLKTQNAILSGENEIIKMQTKIAIISGENEIKKLKNQTAEIKVSGAPEINFQKKKIPEKRKRIADRQGNLCGICNHELSSVYQIDHITGKQFGGTNEETNLMALCCECHANKSITENKCRKQIRDTIQFILMESQTQI